MASLRHQRRRSCTGKVRYPCHGEAVRVAGEQNKALFGGRQVVLGYACGFCGGAHIGHNRNAVKAQVKSSDRLQRKDRRFIPRNTVTRALHSMPSMPFQITPECDQPESDADTWETFVTQLNNKKG